MKDLLGTSFPLDGKKNYHWQESLKNKIKIVSTSQKISLPLARISSFFKTVSPLTPIMASTGRKIALI